MRRLIIIPLAFMAVIIIVALFIAFTTLFGQTESTCDLYQGETPVGCSP